MEETVELSARYFVERSSLVFVKITEMIYKINKDRYAAFTGSSYVDSNDVLNSLNRYLDVLVLDEKGKMLHKNF